MPNKLEMKCKEQDNNPLLFTSQLVTIGQSWSSDLLFGVNGNSVFFDLQLFVMLISWHCKDGKHSWCSNYLELFGFETR